MIEPTSIPPGLGRSVEPTTLRPASPAAGGLVGEVDPKKSNADLREVFDKFVGQTFYSQMLSAMRKGQEKPAYFNGGRGEEVFQAQLDQVLSEKMAEASASQFTEPMFNLFMMARK